MSAKCAVGDQVQTPLGKGIVREVRNNGRYLVEVHGRSVVLEANLVSPAEAAARGRAQRGPRADESSTSLAPDAASFGSSRARVEVDLHGLTVSDALARAEQALNEAMLKDAAEVRLIHGRSGGRIRAALHRRLREIPSVRAFRLDPRNEGMTIVTL